MARPLRIEYPGAWYHVMNRGAGRQQIFKNDDHYRHFLSLLAETKERFGAEWHAYCLMGNHYHLLVRTPEGNLQRIMRHINGLYTQYFNRSTRRDGPLFRGRYKAILVDADAYWLQLSRYIHRNPLEAGLIDSLERYHWSSYPDYIGKRRPPAWLTTDYVLNAIGKRSRHARYKAYVAGGSDAALGEYYRQARMEPILGDDAFKQRVLAGRAHSIDVPELARVQPRPGVAAIVSAVVSHYGLSEEEIWRSRRGKAVQTPARSVAMYLCQQAGGMRLSDIAKVFGLSGYAGAGSTIRSIKQRLRGDKGLERDINSIMLDLTP
ncbi:MAG: transposase [Gammaproteobacteria bacterium]|nr:transposase [Gammaproteobacteria bacterium]MCW8992721.1 transposase [Gammaproteobacteria bacterium]